jgi:hypothetical protein
MKTQVRVLMILAIVVLAAGWVGLRRGNAALEKRLAASPVGTTEVGR